eukprot:Sdes_comp20649_c0_seq1m15929
METLKFSLPSEGEELINKATGESTDSYVFLTETTPSKIHSQNWQEYFSKIQELLSSQASLLICQDPIIFETFYCFVSNFDQHKQECQNSVWKLLLSNISLLTKNLSILLLNLAIKKCGKIFRRHSEKRLLKRGSNRSLKSGQKIEKNHARSMGLAQRTPLRPHGNHKPFRPRNCAPLGPIFPRR